MQSLGGKAAEAAEVESSYGGQRDAGTVWKVVFVFAAKGQLNLGSDGVFQISSSAYREKVGEIAWRTPWKRAVPSLDGLRALSVLVVILGHTKSAILDRIPFNASFRDGGKGGAVFFVISGFLITHLLLKELNRDEKINLKRFYLRRTFRIFPPFYAFLLVVATMAFFKVVHVSPKSLVVAATYTWNYIRTPETWVLGHC